MDAARRWQIASVVTAVAGLGMGAFTLTRPTVEPAPTIVLEPVADVEARTPTPVAPPDEPPTHDDGVGAEDDPTSAEDQDADDLDGDDAEIVPPAAVPSEPPVASAASIDSPADTASTSSSSTSTPAPRPAPDSPDSPASVDSVSSIDT